MKVYSCFLLLLYHILIYHHAWYLCYWPKTIFLPYIQMQIPINSSESNATHARLGCLVIFIHLWKPVNYELIISSRRHSGGGLFNSCSLRRTAEYEVQCHDIPAYWCSLPVTFSMPGARINLIAACPSLAYGDKCFLMWRAMPLSHAMAMELKWWKFIKCHSQSGVGWILHWLSRYFDFVVISLNGKRQWLNKFNTGELCCFN